MPLQDRETRAMTSAGLNLIQQALSIYDVDLRLVVGNRRFQEMFDLPDTLVSPGASFEDTIRFLVERGEYGPQEDIDAAIQERVDVARAFQSHYMERERPDGSTIAVEGAPLAAGGWVTVYTDITRVKRQEELLRARSEVLSEQVLARNEELAATNRALEAANTALEEKQRALTELEARTRHITEMMPAHIAHLDLDRRYTFSNRRLATVLPGRPTGITGRTMAEVLGTQTYALIQPNLDRAYVGEPVTFEFKDPLSARRVRLALTPETDEGAVSGVYILSMDITEETQSQAALQQTRRREMAAQLTSGLAHDFANLLTIILGMQARLGHMDLPGEASGLIAATQSAARRGGALLDRIAGMTSARALDPHPTDLSRLFTDLETLARPSLPPGISLRSRYEGPDREVLLDPGMVQDTLLNLLLNAGDASRDAPGGGHISLICRVVQDTWIEFTVSDCGPGFSDEALRHGFEPFFTTKGGEGSGLGLAMVYDMTKLAGGEVSLSNGYRGARVIVRLPLRAADVSPTEGAVLDKGMALLVEDSVDLRETLRDQLTALGYPVIEAASAEEARALVHGLHGLSLILSDLSLEGEETGLDLARSLQRTGIPLQLMTSLPPQHPLHKSAARQFPVLQKPFATPDLTQALEELCP